MNSQLPKAVETYFQAVNSYDSSLFYNCFTENAILYDEGSIFRGIPTIEAHIIKANNALSVKSVIDKVAEKDGKMTAALAAGGHFNPDNVAHHGTPNDGHKGDLPVLNVDANGNANTTMLAPRLKLSDIQGLAIMIHAGGDNYSDYPKPLGGGGARIACGVIH